jgi:putative CRISPR-associated protein (TIGR02620 family)
MIYIVTRHAGAVAWLRAKGFDGEVVPHLTGDRIRPGNTYIGVLPVPVIQQILDAGSRFYLLVLPEVTPAQRDREMTPEEMDAAGARLVEVKRIETAPVEMKG